MNLDILARLAFNLILNQELDPFYFLVDCEAKSASTYVYLESEPRDSVSSRHSRGIAHLCHKFNTLCKTVCGI